MATYQAVNIRSGTAESAKYTTPALITEVWTFTSTTILASGDIINGPLISQGCYLVDLTIDVGALGGTAAFSVGYVGQTAAFITAAGNGAVAGGLARMNAMGSVGYTPAAGTNTQVQLVMTGAAAANGRVAFAIEYTANP